MTETLRFVFAHGSGRAGVNAWPQQAELTTDAAFLTFPGFGQDLPVATNIDAWVHCILDACTEPSHVVASSYGGIAAILAAAARPDLIRSLILFEPAAYSLARGRTNVEARIDRMSPIMDSAPHLSASDYFVKFIGALTDSEPPPPLTDAEMTAAERLRLLAPPWSQSLQTKFSATCRHWSSPAGGIRNTRRLPKLSPCLVVNIANCTGTSIELLITRKRTNSSWNGPGRTRPAWSVIGLSSRTPVKTSEAVRGAVTGCEDSRELP